MSISTSNELFINMKSIPTEDSEEYRPFFEEELAKIRYGLTIDGVFIHGWLYWHINHWHIYLDEIDEANNDIVRKFRNPDFRDNEWLIAENIKKAEEAKKGLLIFGTRRFSKTVFESSWIGRGATIYEGSENVISSTNSDDLKILSAALESGLGAVHPYFYFPRLADNWGKEVTFGYKDSKGKRNKWSTIYVRNLDEGRKTEAIAGTTPKTLVIDEIGKAPFELAFEAAKPGFTSTFGWRCVPILTGTGGSFKPNSDAQRFFEEPEAHNFLGFEIPNKKNKYGLFVSGIHRMEGKIKVKFGEFIQRKSGILIPENSELNQIPFFDSDEEKAKAVIAEEIEQASKAKDKKAALKARMYYPLVVDDCFLNDDINNFPIEAIEQHLAMLEESSQEQYVEFYRDMDGIVRKTFNTKLAPISEYPANKNTFKDAPVIIYEDRMMENPPVGLYIAGSDPYNQAQSENSSSVGTLYIYKRMYDSVGGTFQDRIVASFASRPELMKDWHETVEMILEYYNAILMTENEGATIVQWFDQRMKSHMLADGYDLLREISPATSIRKRPKGLPATVKVQTHWMNLVVEYTKAKINVGLNPITKEPIIKLGCIRIPDKMLLREMLAYFKGANVDRIVAFGHVLAYDGFLFKHNPTVKMNDEVKDVKPEQRMPKSPFIMGRIKSPFLK